MSVFLALAGLLALIAVVVLLHPLVLGRGSAQGRDAKDMAVYRDQLAELERDLARGTITEAEAAGTRAEISRRLIRASARAEKTRGLAPGPAGATGLVAGLSFLAVPVIAAVVYLAEGRPGLPDRPFAERAPAARADAGSETPPHSSRPTQAEAEAMLRAEEDATAPAPEPRLADQIAELERIVEARPADAEPHRLLGIAYFQAERYDRAWRAMAEAIDLAGPKADGGLLGNQIEAMVRAAGGYLSPEAEAAIERALSIAPGLPAARYYAGMAHAQAGRLDRAIAVWEGLLADAPADAPWRGLVEQVLAEARLSRGGTPRLPDLEGSAGGAGGSSGGPSAADIEAAGQMSAAERMEMVESMVARLDERLRRQGGPPEKWMQLINSYMQLGRRAEAVRGYERAMAALDGEAAARVAEGARRLGLDGAGGGGAAGGTGQAAGGQAGADAPGPTAADIEAARQMSAEERQAMISDMVARLEDRLTSEGGSAEEWYRLMTSYMRLGRREEAARAYALSQQALSGQEAGFIRQQALLMGVIDK